MLPCLQWCKTFQLSSSYLLKSPWLRRKAISRKKWHNHPFSFPLLLQPLPDSRTFLLISSNRQKKLSKHKRRGGKKKHQIPKTQSFFFSRFLVSLLISLQENAQQTPNINPFVLHNCINQPTSQ